MKLSQRSLIPVLFFSCLGVLFASQLQTAFSLDRPEPQKKIVIAVEDAAAPWSLSDGTGYANDVVISAFKAVDVDVELRVVPYARCKHMAVNGEVLACFSTSPSSDFKGALTLSDQPLFTVKSAYFYNVNKPPRVKNQSSLPKGTTVGTVLGYEYPSSFENLKLKGVIVTDESPSEELNFRKLAAQRIDLALLNYNEMKTPMTVMKRAGVEGQVKEAFLAGIMNSYIGFSNKHPEGMKSLKEFNRGYALINSNGTLRRIKSDWLKKSN